MRADLVLAVALLALSVAVRAGTGKYHPVLLGVDTAGGKCYEFAGADLGSYAPFVKAMRELGAELVVYHLNPVTDKGADNARLTAERIRAVDAGMRASGLKYTLNNEHCNWFKWVNLEPGKNEYAHDDGTHRWDLRVEWLDPLLSPDTSGRSAFLGVTYDETAHMQLTSHQYCSYPDGDPLDAPLLVDTDGMPLERAFDLLVGKCRRIRLEHYQGRVQPMTEQVWPDMFHVFARAGWTVAPKLLKENLSSVVMSIALGAALEYAGNGTALWVSPDLWYRGEYPGHSVKALRSATMMGYWLGADAVYVENIDYPYGKERHPDAGPWSLIEWTDSQHYELTPYGQVYKDFAISYVPAHPRTIRWQDYRPKVAIIRLPDGAWGQKDTVFRDRLLGNRNHPMDEISAEWLQVWPILTHGAARPGAISLNNGKVYPDHRYPFFVPIDSVAVFDHLVTGSVLDSVKCFVVCGHALSGPTFDEVARRVSKGATCIIARRLYEKHASGPLPGKWAIVDSFGDPAVSRALKPFLGPPDVARFEFADQVVEFGPCSDRDEISVSVSAKR